jgi:hypothetical protein
MPGIEVGAAGVGINPQTIAQSPAYKFRLDQGLEAINRSAQSRGTLLTGGTLKDLTGYAQGLASTEYDNEWQRQFGLAGLNANIGMGNANRTLSGLLGLSGYGLNAAGGMAGAYGNYGQAQAGGTYGGASAINQGMTGVANTLGGWLAARRGQQPGIPNGGIPNGGIPGATTPPFVPSRTSGGWGSS